MKDFAETAAPERLACFGNYDIRGRVGRDLTAAITARIGAAIAEVLAPRMVVVGRDCRLSGPSLAAALTEAMRDAGVSVIDIGLAGTEEVYFAIEHFGAEAGIAVTASHNPASDNGFKIVGRGACPLSAEAFAEIAARSAVPTTSRWSVRRGKRFSGNVRGAYAEALVDMVAPRDWPHLTVLSNPGQGVAGPAFDAIAAELSRRGANFGVVRLNHAPDGRFPKGVPNPLLSERRAETTEAVRGVGADLGIAWDGDFDRCFLFDHTGAFVDGAHLAALLGGAFAEETPGATVLHDARIIWPMRDAAARHGAKAVAALTGHVHMKRAMRETGAVYGGEMSGHHYFRGFLCCDSGMLPWLKVLDLMARRRRSLAELVKEVAAAHPVSGEINYRSAAPERALAIVGRSFGGGAVADHVDGLSLTFDDWRFNLRASSTEVLLRLNVETRGNVALLEARKAALDRTLVEDAECIRVT